MPDPKSLPIQLTILRQGELNIIDLAEVGSLIPRSETRVDDAFLRDLAAEMRHLGGGSGTHAPGLDLERIGRLIYSHLLTEPARARLDAAEPTDLHLRLDEQLVDVPWELCHDGRDFLAMRHRVGRQVITNQPIPAPRLAPTPREHLRVLLVADPTETLPKAGDEVEQLCALLDTIPRVDVTLLAGRTVRRLPLLAALQEHDVVHFAGHSHYDADAPSAERMAARRRRADRGRALEAASAAAPRLLELLRGGRHRRVGGRPALRGPRVRHRKRLPARGRPQLRRHLLGGARRGERSASRRPTTRRSPAGGEPRRGAARTRGTRSRASAGARGSPGRATSSTATRRSRRCRPSRRPSPRRRRRRPTVARAPGRRLPLRGPTPRRCRGGRPAERRARGHGGRPRRRARRASARASSARSRRRAAASAASSS